MLESLKWSESQAEHRLTWGLKSLLDRKVSACKWLSGLELCRVKVSVGSFAAGSGRGFVQLILVLVDLEMSVQLWDLLEPLFRV